MKKSSRSGKQKLPREFLKKLKSVTAKRAKTVIDHILKHGLITTEELSSTYGYDHPPRAVRDVREYGIPIETFRAKAQNGRSIAAYRFGDPTQVRAGRNGGRTAWPKQFKEQLADTGGRHCAICLAEYELRYLQIDHRVPFEVAGEPEGIQQPSDFMLVCGSCNRAKSWSCEHCSNWRETHDESVCRSCYWPRRTPTRTSPCVWFVGSTSRGRNQKCSNMNVFVVSPQMPNRQCRNLSKLL